jgi:hypothetical protein
MLPPFYLSLQHTEANKQSENTDAPPVKEVAPAK